MVANMQPHTSPSFIYLTATFKQVGPNVRYIPYSLGEVHGFPNNQYREDARTEPMIYHPCLRRPECVTI